MLRSLNQQNSDTGYNATKKVVAQLSSFCNAKVLQAEGADDLGSDLIAQFKDPTSITDKFIIGFQVKTGPSYIEVDEKDRIKIKNLKKDYLKRISAFNIPIIIIWFDEKSEKAYYEFLARRHNQQFAYISRSCYLSPFSIYDLMVKVKKVNMKTSSDDEILKINKLSAPLHIPLIDVAKKYYKKELQKKEIKNPHLGHISISNYCWRHMTRKGKNIRLIRHAFESLPFTIHAIKKSKIIEYTGFSLTKRGDQEIAWRTIKLKSEFRVNIDGNLRYIILKVKERVIYPIAWRNIGRVFGNIERDLTLESIYFLEK